MKPFRQLLASLLASTALVSSPAAEPAGDWRPPPENGLPWKHATTGLNFPQRLGAYRLAGEFQYSAGPGVFLRYECLAEQARADIFLFPIASPVVTVADQQNLILKEMDSLVADLQAMEKQGRYRDLNIGELGGGSIQQWKSPALPIASRIITATRLGKSEKGADEAMVSQWIGVTVVGPYMLTIRHLRPMTTGQEGEAGLKAFVGMVFQLIKEPPLRKELSRLVESYLENPFTDEGKEAATAVLAYLKQNPFHPISVPENPFTLWLGFCKAAAPGTEENLLTAYMIGAAKAAFADGDANACFNEGSRQFGRIYRMLLLKHPRIGNPDMDKFAAAADRGEASKWLEDYIRGGK